MRFGSGFLQRFVWSFFCVINLINQKRFTLCRYVLVVLISLFYVVAVVEILFFFHGAKIRIFSESAKTNSYTGRRKSVSVGEYAMIHTRNSWRPSVSRCGYMILGIPMEDRNSTETQPKPEGSWLLVVMALGTTCVLASGHSDGETAAGGVGTSG